MTAWSSNFDPPTAPITDRVRLDVLGPAVTELDYEAIMGSRVRLRAELQWGKGWPRDDFTLEENRADLAQHLAELERREAYAYTVLDPEANRCIGCVYMEPWNDDVRLAFWVIDDELETGLESHLVEVVASWAGEAWPFERMLIALKPENPRAIAVVEALGFRRLDEGGLEAHVNLAREL